jgi:hypothetical protein
MEGIEFGAENMNFIKFTDVIKSQICTGNMHAEEKKCIRKFSR